MYRYLLLLKRLQYLLLLGLILGTLYLGGLVVSLLHWLRESL